MRTKLIEEVKINEICMKQPKSTPVLNIDDTMQVVLKCLDDTNQKEKWNGALVESNAQVMART